ncbi:MAG: helix-turn-helix transcriptional regulator [Candidatus Thorarchaeota archaeon]|nr:MAG: helix-turn-helix transcriptional regulator [Candidatus Thorarchaeota archaeon]
MSASKEEQKKLRLMEILSDAVRSRIYLEVLIGSEVTARQLMEQLTIGRSTLTHHLAKMVESGLLEVTVKPTGRPVKIYTLRPDTKQRLEIELRSYSSEKHRERVSFLESAASHLQMIANLATETAKLRRAQFASLSAESAISDPMCFTFLVLSEKQARIWNEEYTSFLKEVEKKLESVESKAESDSTHIAFAGLLPIVRRTVGN